MAEQEDKTDIASACMQDLKAKLSVLNPLLQGDGSIALVGEPVHRNIGDHLIQLGTERYLADQGFEVLARSHRFNYRADLLGRRLRAGTVILLSGGGHLGDLYPWHQRLRERVLRDFPSHRVVQLPQSIYFQDKAARAACARAFRSHSDFHLVLRDRDSLERAEGLSLQAPTLAPDMCHALYPLERKGQGAGALLIQREDKERDHVSDLTAPEAVADWPGLLSADDTITLATIVGASSLGTWFGAEDAGLANLDRWRRSLCERAVELLSNYQEVYSTRLHGGLLAILLGRRAHFLANLTGKSQSYYTTWLSEHPDVEVLY